MEYNDLELNIGYIFIEKDLLNRALTTNGYANEFNQQNPNYPSIQSQDAFRTLGDAVLKLILVDHLIENKKYNRCGEITEEKKQAENRKTLARISRKLDIGHFLKMGTGEREHDKIYDNDDNLAETLEAIIGAIYLDIGFEASKKIIMKWPEFESFIE
ncbi:MAG TPA: ribonuclease III domain-containing protein [Candidatus Methanoperedens sp.]